MHEDAMTAAADPAPAATPPAGRRWLVKTDPGEYGYGDLEREGRVAWDGVKNALALIHMRAMHEGDPVLVYHSGREKAVVGLARVARDPYPDPTPPVTPGGEADPARRVAVDFAPVARAATRVPIAAIRAEPACADLALVRVPRLFVMPIPPSAWDAIVRMAGLAA